MSCTIVIRRACTADESARADLIRASLLQYTRDAFFMFFFQELTLQLSILSGAVLFIFCGASVAACCVLVPAVAALFVAVSVYVTHAVLADKHVVGMRREMFGYVAELSAPLLIDPRTAKPRVLRVPDHGVENIERDAYKFLQKQVVGTVSVSELRDTTRGSWLHALAVHEPWRRRGVARALVCAAREAAAREPGGALLTAVSSLQAAPMRLLHSQGWEVRGSYHRPLLGSALTLPVLVLGVEPAAFA